MNRNLYFEGLQTHSTDEACEICWESEKFQHVGFYFIGHFIYFLTTLIKLFAETWKILLCRALPPPLPPNRNTIYLAANRRYRVCYFFLISLCFLFYIFPLLTVLTYFSPLEKYLINFHEIIHVIYFLIQT